MSSENPAASAHGGWQRLDRRVAAQLGVSNSEGRRLVVAGAVRVNGRTDRRPSAQVVDNDVVGVAASRSLRDAQRTASAVPAKLGVGSILFEDDWLIAFDKPAGLVTHGTLDAGRPHLHGAALELLSARDGGDVYLGIHQRLDRDTSGVVLFTKDRSINAAIGEAFASHAMDKTYLAQCAGRRPPAAWTVRDHLGPVGRIGKTTRFGAVHSGGDAAHTDFALLDIIANGRFVVQASPRTGRTHQIRVHLAGCGLPIVGDRLYGGLPGPRALLHAEALRFRHPLTGAEITITSPPPPDMAG